MTDTTTRLHVSPLTPDLLTAVLGSTLGKVAQNISYHSLQTFPEATYGYIDLPPMDAEKVKKKLNGAILRGKKVKVEEARPKKRRHIDTEESVPAEDVTEEIVPSKSKKSKKDTNTIPAHELSPDRKVKRGWTEGAAEKTKKKREKKDKKKDSTKVQPPSKYSEKEELLFKTKVPSNKKGTDKKDSKKKKKDKSGADVVHEFEHNTTTPSFLRDTITAMSKPAVEYRDGQGWVDEDGNLVEEESEKASKMRVAAELGVEADITKAQRLERKQKRKQKATAAPVIKPAVSSTSSSSEESEESDEEVAVKSKTVVTEDDTSSSGESSSEIESTDEETESTPVPVVTTASSSSPKPEVHPLEALFKKPNLHLTNPASVPSQETEVVKPTLELNTTFSFFDADIEDEQDSNRAHTKPDTNHLQPVPMTPYSTQDFRSRTMRSAAPTPDTADPRKITNFAKMMFNKSSSPSNSDSDSDSTSDTDTETDPSALSNRQSTPTQQQTLSQAQIQPQPSDFEKRFWEKRGENNRAWKARRRTVLKEKRQRENRARRPKTW